MRQQKQQQHQQRRAAAVVLLALLAGVPVVVAPAGPTDSVRITEPAVKRTEGRITLEWISKEQSIRHELAFSEVVDSETRRSKVSIGFVSYEPSVYYARGETVLTLDKRTGLCTKLNGDQEPPSSSGDAQQQQQQQQQQLAPVFVPELSWYLKWTFTERELRDALPEGKGHHVGPTGLLLMLFKHKFEFDRKEKYRNVNCLVAKSSYGRSKAPRVLGEIFTPDLQLFDKLEMNVFSVRESARQVPDGRGGVVDAIMTIDYFYIEPIDKRDARQLEKLESDLSMPLGRGCSEYLEPYGKFRAAPNSELSFAMSFDELRSLAPGALTTLAYDHEFNYLRMEREGDSLAIWDLNEDLLYHVDKQFVSAQLVNAVNVAVPLEQCSVLSLESSSEQQVSSVDSSYGEWIGLATTQAPAGGAGGGGGGGDTLTKPYTTRGTSIKLMSFLGADEIVYLGRTSIRGDQAALVFETILSEPPKVFQLDVARKSSGNRLSSNGTGFDFIVQYLVLKSQGGLSGAPRSGIDGAGGQSFQPARINLYRRNKQNGAISLANSLEVHNFHWGLFGLTRRPSQLFMMPACFDDEDEQARVELALEFPSAAPENRSDPAARANRELLAKSQYKLEWDLMNDLFRSLQLSRLHATEYEVSLRQHQVLVGLVLSDRLEDKRVSFFGEGELAQPDSYLNNRIELMHTSQASSPSACLMAASHVKDISLAVHCPGGTLDRPEPTCTAIFGETQPAIKKSSSPPSSAPGSGIEIRPCQVFRFEAREPPKSGLTSVKRLGSVLRNRSFAFEALGASSTLEARYTDFEVTRQLQLITINNYRFALSQAASSSADSSRADNASTASASSDKLVRYFDSVEYKSSSDCERVCNFDASCRSYSFCKRPSGGDDETPRCVLSSLDLRANDVDAQLVSARPTDDHKLIVRDTLLAQDKNTPGGTQFALEMKSGCDIYERDILSMFAEADESLAVDARLADIVQDASSASECARRVLALEAKLADSYRGASFAYCPQTQSCLTDESLFVHLAGPAAEAATENADQAAPAEPAELACQMYRKRYQAYFDISPRVMKRATSAGQEGEQERPEQAAGPIKQIELTLSTVEECARACWESFGHVCLSFSYCTPGTCVIDAINTADGRQADSLPAASTLEYEFRAGCLGYKRDLRWDHLRREHLIGSHKVLDIAMPAGRWRGGILINLALLCACAVLFVVGLVVGRVFNDHLELATSTHRSGSLASESTRSFGSFFAPGAATNGAGNSQPTGSLNNVGGRRSDRLSTNSKFNIENEIYEDPNAIRLEDFSGGSAKQANATDWGRRVASEPERANDVGDRAEQPARAPASSELTSEQRRAGFMDVPDLL